MRPNASVLAIAAVSVFLAGSALLGCKGGSPTSPYGTGNMGGGGSGNTPFNSGTVNAPASFVRVFPTVAAVGYHCNFHENMGMVGTVNVVDGAADSAVVIASGTSFAPASVSIKPGGYVHWKITSGTHTVTSD